MVAQGVVEEKASRVVEIVLSSVRPWQLLLGKVLGLGAVGLLQLVVLGGAGLAVAGAAGVLSGGAGLVSTVVSVVVWYLLGFALYATVFAAAGSLVSRQEDTQSVLSPITITVLLGFVVGFNLLTSDPRGTAITVISLLPPFSPLFMPARIALGVAPVGQVVLAFALTIAFTAAVLAPRRADLRELGAAHRGPGELPGGVGPGSPVTQVGVTVVKPATLRGRPALAVKTAYCKDHRMLRRPARLLGATIAVLAFVLAGCGGLSGSGQPAARAAASPPAGSTFPARPTPSAARISTSSCVLCKAHVAALQSVGATVNDRCGIQGTAAARARPAQRRDRHVLVLHRYRVDHRPKQPGRSRTRSAVRRRRATWTCSRTRSSGPQPTPFNNTYAIATTKAFASRTTHAPPSDWANFINSGNPRPRSASRPSSPAGTTACRTCCGRTASPASRTAAPACTVLDTGAIYQATAERQPVHVRRGVHHRRPHPARLNLVSLADDKNFFPIYNASNTIRRTSSTGSRRSSRFRPDLRGA